MYPSAIPTELDAEILVRSLNKEGTRSIAAWVSEKTGVRTSHSSVGRRLRKMKSGDSQSLAAMEQDVWADLRLNLTDLEEAEGRLMDLEELAFDGDEARGIKPDLALAGQLVLKRATLILNKHKFLQGFLRESRARSRKTEASGFPAAGAARVSAPAAAKAVVATTETEPMAAAVRAPVGVVAVPVHTEPPRNGPCSCGSGMKYKRCCGRPGAPRLPASGTPGGTLQASAH